MILFRPSQCAGPGFCMNCDKTPTAYATSGLDTTAGHRTLPIASLNEIPFILATWFGIDGDWALEYWVPDSIGVPTGLASVSQNFSATDSMNAC